MISEARPITMLSPAETLQEEPPVISLRFSLLLAFVAAGIVVHHIYWSARI